MKIIVHINNNITRPVHFMKCPITVTPAKKPAYQRLIEIARSIKTQQTFHRSIYDRVKRSKIVGGN